MARVYSTRFGQWKDETGYVSLVNETEDIWIIRQICVWNGNVLENNSFYLYDYNLFAVQVVFGFAADGALLSWWRQWQGRIVIPPGPGTGLTWGTDGFGVDVLISGYTLTP
jgi:hypothetical protein